jgi:hypothetical protein
MRDLGAFLSEFIESTAAVGAFFGALFSFMPSPFPEIMFAAIVMLGIVIAFKIIKTVLI